MWGWKPIKDFIKRTVNRIPRKLPSSSSDFDSFIDDVLNTYHLPNNDSHRHAIATMILHLEPDEYKKSKWHFATALYAAQSREVAYQKMQEIKEAQKKAKETPAPLDVTPEVQSESSSAAK